VFGELLLYAWLVASSSGASPGAWPPTSGAASGEWRERPGTLLRIVDGELVRVRGRESTRLGCTDPEGTGRVLDVALDPAGLAFVVAERGLFVLGPFVDALDAVAPRELAPGGRPTSVYVDDARRVWLATDEAIGVIDPSFFFARTLARSELPGDGPYRVARAPGDARAGAVRLVGAHGEGLRVPDAGARPLLTSLRIDGAELDDEARLAREPGGELWVEARGEADGGATFRYRFDQNQAWRELASPAALDMPHPGEHTLEVIAIDQDLDRSAPRLVHVRVAYPRYYDAAFVLTAIGVAAALALAAFLLAQRARGRLRPWRALVSTGLVVVLALQVVAGIVPHGRGWPFMGFNMYTRSYARDEIVYREQLIVLHADGSELAVRPESAGFVVDEPWEVLRPLIDGGEPALRAYLETWLRRFPDPEARGLQLQARRSRLTPTGPVAIAPLVLAHFIEETR